METREIIENVHVDYDQNGNLVSMTIEPAATNNKLRHLPLEEIDAIAASRLLS